MRHHGIKAAVVLMAATSTATAQHSDVDLRFENGRVMVSARVFEGEFGGLLPNQTAEPGFEAEAGMLPRGQAVGLTIRRAAKVWLRGTFCEIPIERLEVRNGGEVIETPASDPAGAVGPSIELGVTDPIDGSFHEDAVYRLTAPFGDGVYLLELEAWIAQPGIGTSEPIWIVLNQSASEVEHEAAAAWMRASLAPCGCQCDWNSSGGLSVQDIFDYLTSYFAGTGDFNGQGGVTVQDIFDFLTCYFGGCV